MKTRRLGPLAIALALGTGLAAVGGAEAAAVAAEPSGDEESDSAPEAAPGPTVGATHADCDHRMPVWDHEVQPGEHLGLVAGRYGVRQADLLRLNPDVTDPNRIRIGQKLRVCPEIYPHVQKTLEHVVAKGETLTSIAAQHELSIDELVAMQGGKLRDPNHVRIGQTLTLVVDGGLVAQFQPPPKKVAKRRAGGKRRSFARVDAQLSTSADLYVKRPRLAWGTRHTIDLLEGVARRYRSRAGGGPKMLVGDISQRGGGQLPPHLSHRHGRDIDVGYVLEGVDGRRTRFSGVTTDNLDHRRTWALLKAFLDTNEVVYIFMDYRLQKSLYEWAKDHGEDERLLDEVFQYPRGQGRNHGIVRHWRSHRHHFHVRFR
jgi:LysM repeat protein